MKKTIKIFVASSTESKSFAEKVVGFLEDIDEFDIVVVPWWKYGVFVTGQITLNEVLRSATECDAGIFVLGKSDCITGKREGQDKEKTYISSDNVLVEAGIFYGMKDSAAVCLFTDEGVSVPSDLNGITRIIHKENKTYKIKSDIIAWIKKLKNHSGKYVLADSHGIENVKPVFITNKNHIENTLTLQSREQDAIEIRLLNYAGSSFLSGSGIAEKYDESWNTWFNSALAGDTKFTIVLTDPNSPAAKDAAKYKMYPQGGLKVITEDIIPQNIEKIKELYKVTSKNS